MPKLPSFPVEGGCICGAVRYQISDRPLGVYNCHCTDCRRSAGSAYSSSMIVRRESFTLLKGDTQIYDKLAASGRTVRQHSCPVCSTRMFNEPLSNSAIFVVRPGTLDDSSWATPIGNIWINSKVPWVEIDPDAPNFPGQAEPRDALFAAWAQYIEHEG